MLRVVVSTRGLCLPATLGRGSIDPDKVFGDNPGNFHKAIAWHI
jgi:hypothetical protein